MFKIFFVFLKLGLICFGGPIAHLGFFHHEFVEKRRWIDEKTYMDLVSLCQTLPGPASSQVAISIGIKEHGLLGGIAAIVGFILPSVIIMILAAYGLYLFGHQLNAPWLHGLKIAVVAVIAQAILNMGKRFCTDVIRIIITVIATAIAVYFTNFIGQISVIIMGAVIGTLFLNIPHTKVTPVHFLQNIISFRSAIICWGLFFIILISVPIINSVLDNRLISLFNIFYRTGSVVFGGGHVVLPLLQSQIVTPGWIDNNIFLAGYGLTQAVPGPLFSFAGFLGTAIKPNSIGWLIGLFCTFAIYLPSFLILIGVLPLWEKYRHHSIFQTILAGISAAVVGLLIAAFYNPVWTTTILSFYDFVISFTAFLLLQFMRWPQWLIVFLCVLARSII